MILVFGGTTEGKQVASILDELQIPYIYSTKTAVNFYGKGKAISGAMTKNEIEVFCVKNKIRQIINASHPFAEVLHETVASINNPIEIIRFERVSLSRKNHEGVFYTDSYVEVLSHLKQKGYKSMLALSGVQTIKKLSSFWQKNKTWFRILDRLSSKLIAKTAHFPEEQLIYGFPQLVEKEIALFKKLQPEVVFTKESGINGKLDAKIEAAIELNIPILILSKPLLSKRYLCVSTKENLIQLLK